MAEDEYATKTKQFGNGDVYIGTWSQSGFPDGEGKYTWRDGSVFEGSWKEGVRHGIGKYTWPSGATYHGEWRDGCMSGVGTWESPDLLSRYQGGWLRDSKHGLGRQVYASGDVYEGLWKQGAPGGPGRYVYSDGNEYDGEWRGGRMHGQGTFVWRSGERYDGEWKDGRMDGAGVFSAADGSLYDGRWRRGRKHGVGIFRPSPLSHHQQQQQQQQAMAIAATATDSSIATFSLRRGVGISAASIAAAGVAAVGAATSGGSATAAVEPTPGLATAAANGAGEGGLRGLALGRLSRPMHPHPSPTPYAPPTAAAEGADGFGGGGEGGRGVPSHAAIMIAMGPTTAVAATAVPTAAAGLGISTPLPHASTFPGSGPLPPGSPPPADEGCGAAGQVAVGHSPGGGNIVAASPLPGAVGAWGPGTASAVWRTGRSGSGVYSDGNSARVAGPGAGGCGATVPASVSKLVFVRVYDKGRLLRETALSADELDALLPGGLGVTGGWGR
ncbi:hypothetical protein VaNZ11_005581, partial [Volvox africanus]